MKKDEFDKIRWLNAFAKRRQEDDIKQAGLSQLTARLEVQSAYFGQDNELMRQQTKIIKRMVRNAEDGGSLSEFRVLAHQLGQLQAEGLRAMMKQGPKAKR